ncbi:MAG: DEAD/DEAH box helicase, partial [Planctomycetota bacterium]|nr:DEAD/DEAH box helicase [Planctomycetota bacterium]
MSRETTDILNTVFGFDEFRGPQEAIIDTVTDGNHALVLMPTGMGKSLCYQVPALLLSRRSTNHRSRTLSLVISPLIALMQDQV